MKIIDCFMYFDEDMLLDLRLNIMDKFVSKFIICESVFNHKGIKKKLNFDINKFKKFKDKIIYIALKDQPNNIKEILNDDDKEKQNSKIIYNSINRDIYQRNHLMSEIENFEDDDLILISDLDEIPNLNNFTYKKKISVFCQKMFYYKFNLIYPNFIWYGTKACKKKYLISPQWLRNIKSKKYNFWRLDAILSKKKYINLDFINNGGWHFTNIKKAEDIHFKMQNFAHHLEYESSGITLEKLKKSIENKVVFYDHSSKKSEQDKWNAGFKLKKIDLNYLPEYLSENKNKYKNWIEN